MVLNTGMDRGSDLPALGDLNQRVVLDCIRRHSTGISRVEIADLTQLSEQTVSSMTRRLLDDGRVLELGRKVLGPGRPRTLLGPNPDGTYAVGVHIDPTIITTALVDFTGRVVEQVQFQPDEDSAPEVWVADIARRIERLIDTTPAARARLAGVGVAVPGPIDAVRGVMLNPPLLQRWRDVPIARLFADVMPYRILVEKDLIAAAAGEGWLRQQRRTLDFLFVYLGAGLGYGMVRDGSVQRGVSHNFGEVNSYLIATDQPPLTCCHLPGSFAHRVSPEHLTFAAVALGALPAEERRGVRTRAHEDRLLGQLTEQADLGDPASLQVLAVLANDLATGLVSLTDLLDVDEVVLGGHAWARYGRHVQATLAELIAARAVLRTARAVRIQSSVEVDAAIAIGAAVIVIDDQIGSGLTRLATLPARASGLTASSTSTADSPTSSPLPTSAPSRLGPSTRASSTSSD